MSIGHVWVVEGEHTMHCGGCAKSVEFALSRLGGVLRVRADFRTQRIEVETNDEADLTQIVSELADLGYAVREVQGDG